MIIRPPPPQSIARTRGVAVAVLKDARHLSSTPSSNRRNKTETNQHNAVHEHEPWWSLSSLHKRVATAIASTLPDESLTAVHNSLTEKLKEVDSHKSVSINEAIVSARAREAHHQSSAAAALVNNGIANNRNNHTANQLHMSMIPNENQKQLEQEIERRALEKAQERMQLELQAMKEQLKRKESDRIAKELQERKRIELEYQRELAFVKWKEDADVERQMEEEEERIVNGDQGDQEKMNGIESNVKVDAIEIETLDKATLLNNLHSTAAESLQDHHPILGPQIAQLPYKRIHLTAASTLASLPVYEKQRAYRHDRAQVMAKDKKKTLWMGIPGVISLMEEDDGRLSILDGQHRVGMMALLEEEQQKLEQKEVKGIENASSSAANEELAKLDLNNVLVEVFFPRQSTISGANSDSVRGSSQKQSEQDDKAAIFTEINKAEPIKLLDMPGMAPKRTRDIIDHSATHFHNAYPAMFSSSQKCRAPHLNLDNLRDALFASDVIKREKMGSGGELVKWMVQRNEELREQFGDGEEEVVGSIQLESGKKVSETALKKAREHNFYLGLESTWLYK